MTFDIVKRLGLMAEALKTAEFVALAETAVEAVSEIERLRASLADQAKALHVETLQQWALGYEEAENDIIEFLEVRAHDPWPDSQWPAANEVLMQMIDEINIGEHHDMWGEEP